MPFGYFGAKHGLARHYPAPLHDVIIEPFAGSAGYSLRHATPDHRVILIEKDPRIVALWHRLQAMSHRELAGLDCPPIGERSTEPLINTAQGGVTSIGPAALERGVVVTSRQFRDWPKIRRRLDRALDLIRPWEVILGDYADAPDIVATYFVDPPYQTDGENRGARYRHGAGAIDFKNLGEWCRTRPGFVIACEQAGADWLPFRTFHARRTVARHPHAGTRLEVVWTTQDADELVLFDAL